MNETAIAIGGLSVSIVVAVIASVSQFRLSREARRAEIKRETYLAFIEALHGSLRGDISESHRLVRLLDQISITANEDVAIASSKLGKLLHAGADKKLHLSTVDDELGETLRLMRKELTGHQVTQIEWDKMRVRFYETEPQE